MAVDLKIPLESTFVTSPSLIFIICSQPPFARCGWMW